MIISLGPYYPYWLGGARNPAFDHRSGRILDLKGKEPEGVRYFLNELTPLLDRGFAIAIVPSHDPVNTHPGIRLLAQQLATLGYGVDATSCLVRHTLSPKKAQGGPRNVESDLATIRVENADLFSGKEVLLLDDVTTTGGSLMACQQLLLQSGATLVQCVALGQTTW